MNIDNIDKELFLKNWNKKPITVKFHCEQCNQLVSKKVDDHINKRGIKVIKYCKTCLTKMTKQKKYNDPNYNNKAKREETMIQRWGAKTTLESQILNKKQKRTMRRRHGVNYTFSNKKLYKKFQNTMEKRHGTKYPNSDEILDKKRDTILTKHGSYYLGSNRYVYDNITFDSSWELMFYIYHKDKNHNIIREPKYFEYTFNNRTYRYYVDFKVGNQYYEIKGEQFIVRYKNGKVKTFSDRDGKISGKSQNKYKCLVKNNVKLITYVEMKKFHKYFYSNYNKDFLEKLKKK